MKIKLNKIFASNAPVDEFDVRQVKRSLNRLGYYRPPREIGLTDIPDRAVFEALKRFQSDQGLNVTGELRPDDEAVRVMNEEIEKTKDKKYIWRTVGDDRVRGSHAALEGKTRSFSVSPLPGEEPNCRCSAEVIEEESKEDQCRQLNIDLQNQTLERDSLNRRLSEASDRLNEILEELPKLDKAWFAWRACVL